MFMKYAGHTIQLHQAKKQISENTNMLVSKNTILYGSRRKIAPLSK